MVRIAVIGDEFDLKYENCAVAFIPADKKVTTKEWLKYDAVLLREPENPRSLKNWTGHPHLRACPDESSVRSEIEAMLMNIEFERKFLIEYPDFDALLKYYPYKCSIEQIYLKTHSGTHRIRKRVSGGITEYSETYKIRITASKCYEKEGIITESEYEELKNSADPQKAPVIKDRYCFLYKNQYLELDVYPFWKDRAVLELEQLSEEIPYELPPEIKVLKDVTNNIKFKNSYLARMIYENS